MKAAYYFSKEQCRVIMFHGGLSNFLPDGTEYTEIVTSFEDDDEIPLQNNFSDSKLVFVKENCPVNEFMLENVGERFAKVF